MTSYFTTYSLDVELLLTWFPLTTDASLKEPRMIGLNAKFSTKDFPPLTAQGLRLDGGNPQSLIAFTVAAFAEIRVNSDGIFEADLELDIGGARRKKLLQLPANTRSPFMINLSAPGDDQLTQHTAAVFQGVFTTTPLPSLLVEVSAITKRIFGP